MESIYRSVWLNCRRREKLFCATVLPGYDDSHIGRKSPQILEREDGEVYRSTWRQAIASHAPWVAITTFNEWHEGSDIEPSREYGDEYIKMTRRFAEELKGE
jgi:hypothetical protein